MLYVRNAMRYALHMIKSFKSKALAAYWNTGSAAKLPAASLPRIKLQLEALNVATRPEDMNIPGWFFHDLNGKDAGRFSIRVTKNWRITFGWEVPDAVRVDFLDYH